MQVPPRRTYTLRPLYAALLPATLRIYGRFFISALQSQIGNANTCSAALSQASGCVKPRSAGVSEGQSL